MTTVFVCILSECHMRTLSPFLFLCSLCTTVSTQVGFPASLHLTRLLSQIPTNGNAQTHARRSNYVSCIIQKEVASSCSAVQRDCPPPPPLWSVIRELCCSQIELSERLPFNPPFDTKSTQTHLQAVEQSDTHKMEITTGHRSLRGPVWKLWRARFLCGNISVTPDFFFLRLFSFCFSEFWEKNPELKYVFHTWP